jgi:IclR family acetate operon transcriptional repressor
MAVLTRALHLVNTLADESDGIGVNQLSAQLGEPPATVHRMLVALRDEGVVSQDSHSKRYRLGPLTLRWAQAFLRQDTTASAAQPFLDALRSKVTESVFLTELVGDHAVCVATAESPRPLRFFMSLGQRMPWHAAASARAILAYRSDEEARRLLKAERIRRFTSATPLSLTRVMEEIREIRTSGFAACEEELEVGVSALAAPVRDMSGDVLASVSVVAPSQRLSGDARHGVTLEILATAQRISEGLGFRRDSSRAIAPARVARDSRRASSAERPDRTERRSPARTSGYGSSRAP